MGSILSPTTWLKTLGKPPPRAGSGTGRGLVTFLLAAAVLAEACLCSMIILKVPYTEIDWIAYMQEVGGYLSGERDYTKLAGDTGPLVYPAGFVYIYSGLRWLTSHGHDIRTAQWIFAAIYTSMMAVVLSIYRKAAASAAATAAISGGGGGKGAGKAAGKRGRGRAIPLWACLMTLLSRRLHSIFVLRLFNDGIAMALVYAAVMLFMHYRWRWGCLLYSAAVSVKMNILLFAPGLLLLMLQALGLMETLVCLSICAFVQLAVGAPFLRTFPIQYLSRAFEFSRVFKYEWTVNFKFLNEETFLSPILSLALLLCTVIALALFCWKWLNAGCETVEVEVEVDVREGGGGGVQKKGKLIKVIQQMSPIYIVKTLFVSNFIGIAFSRTLHFQFYCWYFHTLPMLLWLTDLPTFVRLAILAGIEIAFNVFPATAWSSLMLQLCHTILLTALAVAPVHAGCARLVNASSDLRSGESTTMTSSVEANGSSTSSSTMKGKKQN